MSKENEEPSSLSLAQLKELRSKMQSALPAVISRSKERVSMSIDDYKGKNFDVNKQRFVLRAGSYGTKCSSCGLSKFRRNAPVMPGDAATVFNRDGIVVLAGYGDNNIHYAINVAMNYTVLLTALGIASSLSFRIAEDLNMSRTTTVEKSKETVREYPEFGLDIIIQKTK